MDAPRLLPAIAGLTPEEEMWLESLAERLRTRRTLEGSDEEILLGSFQSDLPGADEMYRLGEVAQSLFEGSAKFTGRMPRTLDRAGLVAKLARACLASSMTDGASPEPYVQLEAAAALHREAALEPADLPALTATFLQANEPCPGEVPASLWSDLEGLLSMTLARKDLPLACRLAFGLSALAAEFAPRSGRYEMLDRLLAMEDLPDWAARQVLDRILGNDELFTAFRSGKQVIDARGTVVVGQAALGPASRGLPGVAQLTGEVFSAQARAQAKEALLDLDRCLFWLRTAAGKQFARDALVQFTPDLMSRAEEQAEQGLPWRSRPRRPDEEASDLEVRLSKLAAQIGAPPLLALPFLPAMQDVIVGLPSDLVDSILSKQLSSEPAKKPRSRIGRPQAPSHLEEDLSRCAELLAQTVAEDTLPRVRARFSELASLEPADLKALEDELTAARAGLAAGRAVALSPRASLLLFPAAQPVALRSGCRAVPGFCIAAARRLAERGSPLAEVAQHLAPGTWTRTELRAAGPDVGWAIHFIQEYPARFSRGLVELARHLGRFQLAPPEYQMPLARFTVVDARGKGIHRTFDLRLDSTVDALRDAIRETLGRVDEIYSSLDDLNSTFDPALDKEDEDCLLAEFELQPGTRLHYISAQSPMATRDFTVEVSELIQARKEPRRLWPVRGLRERPGRRGFLRLVKSDGE